MFTRYASAEMLFEEARKRGLDPQWETRDGLFSFARNGEDVFVYYGKLHGNSQLGAQICNDKNLTRAFLQREGIASIPWYYGKNPSELNAFFDRHHPLIRKPLLGMRSQGVRMIRERSELDLSDAEDVLFEQYVEGTEYRCLVLDHAIAVQRKTLDPTPDHPWRKRIEILPSDEWPEGMKETAESIARTLRMCFIAVDFLVDSEGHARVLELNAMPGLHSFHHPDMGEPIDLAAMVMDRILRA